MLIEGRYNMVAELQTQTHIVQESGQRLRTWSTQHEFACSARSIDSGGLRTVGSTERFDSGYEEVEWVRVRTKEKVSKRDRISNIRTVNRWNESTTNWTDPDGNPITFEVIGSSAQFDPWGRVLEYELLAKKVVD